MTRPSTAIEHEEWYVRLQARLLLVRLILSARQTALLAHLDVSFPDAEPTTSNVIPGTTLPDAVMTVTWTPPVVQAFDWLPWLHRRDSPSNDRAVRYALFFDRIAHLAHPLYACTPQYQLHTAAADHIIIVVPGPEHIDRVRHAVAQHEPSVVVVAANDIAQQVGHVLHHLHMHGHQESLLPIGGLTDER